MKKTLLNEKKENSLNIMKANTQNLYTELIQFSCKWDAKSILIDFYKRNEIIIIMHR